MILARMTFATQLMQEYSYLQNIEFSNFVKHSKRMQFGMCVGDGHRISVDNTVRCPYTFCIVLLKRVHLSGH